jgi:type IV pilus assembly protein PilY1
MNSYTIRRASLGLFFGVILSAVLMPAEAVTVAQIPLNVGISAAKPNIMLMIDSSGSMDDDIVTTTTTSIVPSGMPSGSKPLKCSSSVSPGVDIPMVVNSSGTARFCLDPTCTPNKQQNFGSGKSGNTKCFKADNTQYTVVNYETKTKLGPYSGAQLNWYFKNANFAAGSLTDLPSATTSTTKRITIAKQAATDLISSLTPDPGERAGFRMGLARYDNSTQGGLLMTEIKDLDATQSTKLTTGVNGITPSGNTPLATTLSDIGKYFAIGETGNLKLHPNATTPTSKSIDDIFSKANGTTPRSITNKTCGSGTCTNTLAAPILGYCQKSFAILISDGLPNGDREISPSLRDYTGDCGTKNLCDATSDSTDLPGGTGAALTATGTLCGSGSPTQWYNKACKNGTKAGRKYERDGSDYLDDVAQALFEMDLRPTLDATDKAKYQKKNNVVTYTIGLADPNLQSDSVLKAAAAVAGGNFYFAGDSKTLVSALDSTISDITSKISSSASVVANTARLDANSAIYQGKFDSSDWTGSFSMFTITPSEDVNGDGELNTNANGSTEDTNNNGKLDGGKLNTTPIWNAVDHIPDFSSRNILTYKPGTPSVGVAFQCANLADSQKTALGISLATGACTSTTDHGVWRLNYIRGDASHEQLNPLRKSTDPLRSTDTTVGIFRNRTHLTQDPPVVTGPDPWLLGDIVNSNPVFVSAESYAYEDLANTTEASAYEAFVADNAARRKMVYVGANDGMLHGFDASADQTDSGKEILAYIPNAVYDGLDALSSPDYSHQYLVDGSPRVGDAYIGGGWHTLLVSTTGAGAKAVFALDITDPSNFGASKVLWEISDTNSPTATDLTTDTTTLRGFAKNLGYTMPQASIVKMKDGSWAAIVANGYDSVNNLAVLYIINVQTGNIIKAIDTQAGSATTPNGLSTPIAVDTDDDRIVDTIYAGDLLGNMWKFDVSSDNPSNWKVAYGTTTVPAPLFVACSDISACDTTRQPITGKPQVSGVGTTQSSGVMVYFGTGKYFETIDNTVTDAQTQSFYGIWDNNATVSKTTTVLQAQTIDSTTKKGGFNLRKTSNNTVNYPTKKGWYMDFLTPPATASDGERVISFPLLRDGRIIFNTLTPLPPPGTDICGKNSEGTSWLMELDALTGSRLADTATGAPWDITGDGMINGDDLVDNVAPSGKESTVGSAGTPGVVSAGAIEYKYTSGSREGEMETTTERGSKNSAVGSRQSWQQLQ